ncbi:MAG: DUF1667 domain-containing protein [Clostridia bacterium]|nr:DUF1667 domain-containing protein [Clostridia bacterium]
MKKELTCIVCPMGCQLVVDLDEHNQVRAVDNANCKRGVAYATAECVAPMRTVTGTAPIVGGGIVPVKTDRAIPKELMIDCMMVINETYVPADAPIGTIIIENVLDTGANVVTTKDLHGVN